MLKCIYRELRLGEGTAAEAVHVKRVNEHGDARFIHNIPLYNAYTQLCAIASKEKVLQTCRWSLPRR